MHSHQPFTQDCLTFFCVKYLVPAGPYKPFNLGLFMDCGPLSIPTFRHKREFMRISPFLGLLFVFNPSLFADGVLFLSVFPFASYLATFMLAWCFFCSCCPCTSLQDATGPYDKRPLSRAAGGRGLRSHEKTIKGLLAERASALHTAEKCGKEPWRKKVMLFRDSSCLKRAHVHNGPLLLGVEVAKPSGEGLKRALWQSPRTGWIHSSILSSSKGKLLRAHWPCGKWGEMWHYLPILPSIPLKGAIKLWCNLTCSLDRDLGPLEGITLPITLFPIFYGMFVLYPSIIHSCPHHSEFIFISVLVFPKY